MRETPRYRASYWASIFLMPLLGGLAACRPSAPPESEAAGEARAGGNESPPTSAIAREEIPALAAEERDAILARLAARVDSGFANGNPDGQHILRFVHGGFQRACDYLNPQLNPGFEGTVFEWWFGFSSSRDELVSEAWAATFEEIGCRLSENEKKALRNILLTYQRLYRLSRRHGAELARHLKPLEEKMRRSGGPRALTKEERRALVEWDMDLMDLDEALATDFFHEFVADLRRHLDRSDYRKVVAFLKSLRLEVRA